MKKWLVIGLVFIINFLFLNFVSAVTINVPTNFPTIQDAINSANPGDVIEVGAGTYNEDLVINKDNIELTTDGSVVTIKGVSNVDIISWPLAIPNIEILGDNVRIHGFIIESPDYIALKYSSGVVIGGKNIEIYDNDFLINSVSSSDEVSQVIQTYSTNAVPGVDISGLHIHNNTFSHKGSNDWGYEGIYVNPDVETSDINISNNIFNGKILRAISSERSKVIIGQNTIITDLVPSPDDLSSSGGYQGINIRKFDGSLQSSILVENNIIGGSDQTKGFNQAIRIGQTGQTFSNVKVNNNLIQNNLRGLLVKVNQGVLVNFNHILNNNLFGVNNEGAGELNATFNWWGSCDGPSGAGSGSGDAVSTNVLFEPFLGICIENKTETACAFENKNADLFANVAGLELNSVLFSYTINGVNKNKTGSLVQGTLNNYSYTINSSELVNGNVSWNVYANDSFGNWFNNSVHTFYVRNTTLLTVAPSNPNGFNGWHVTEPLFNILSDVTKLRSYYEWDSTGAILYNGSFGLENIPNPPEESAGILNLKYFSEFICGNETIQNQTFNIDLTPPKIINLTPANNSIIFNNPRPTIQAYLDEVYSSNSGINKNSVVMKVDDVSVAANVLDAGSIDAIVRYNPLTNLNEGIHNVTVSVEDNAGQNSILTWFFMINLSASDFNLSVNSPTNESYGSKRVPFNITTTKIVNSIEFINHNDRIPRWRDLCRNCDELGLRRTKFINLNEGANNITIKAVDEFDNIKQENINLFIDSKAPIISKTLPKRESVTNGSNFYIKYSEDNLESVSVSWNPTQVLTECTASGRNRECFIEIDLDDFDGEFIDFSFNVSDSIRSVESRKTRVKVDTTVPVLTVNLPENKTDNESYGRRVPFNVSVSEKTIIEFLDNSDFNPRWRRLCSRCNEFGESRGKTVTLRSGIHNIFIRAVDEAGNSDLEEVRFEVV